MDQALRHQVVADARLNQESRPRWTGGVFAVSLLLLGTSYVLLLAAPLVTARLSGLARDAQWAALAQWIPAASGAGLALGGGAALLLVLARLSKDIRQHPYACVAPALAAFAACLLIGLGAKLPLGPSEPLCVFALALSVMGGSLVQESGAGSQLFGWSLTLAPTASLVAAVWAASGQTQLSGAIWSLSPASRLFLAMLALSSVSMALLGMVARTLTSLQESRPRARVVEPVQWKGNPFSEREDTLDIALRSAEIELRRRPIARPLALVLGCALAAAAVGLWQRTQPAASHASAVLEKSPVLARATVAVGSTEAVALVPRVEPYVPTTVETPSAPAAAVDASATDAPVTKSPAPASVSDRESLALASGAQVQAAPMQAGVDEAPSEPVLAETPVVVTSRASHVRKPRVIRPKHKALSRAASRAAKVSAVSSAEVDEAPRESKEDVAHPQAVAAKESKSAPAAAAVAAAPAKSKPATPTRGDESLDELMDRVVEPKRGKASAVSADDPIFGL